jgi:hypothetical protein
MTLFSSISLSVLSILTLRIKDTLYKQLKLTFLIFLCSFALGLEARLFLSLKEVRFFGFGKGNNNLKTRKKEANLFLFFALFFLARREEALPEPGGLMLKLGVYNRLLIYMLYFFKVLYTRYYL